MRPGYIYNPAVLGDVLRPHMMMPCRFACSRGFRLLQLRPKPSLVQLMHSAHPAVLRSPAAPGCQLGGCPQDGGQCSIAGTSACSANGQCSPFKPKPNGTVCAGGAGNCSSGSCALKRERVASAPSPPPDPSASTRLVCASPCVVIHFLNVLGCVLSVDNVGLFVKTFWVSRRPQLHKATGGSLPAGRHPIM